MRFGGEPARQRTQVRFACCCVRAVPDHAVLSATLNSCCTPPWLPELRCPILISHILASAPPRFSIRLLSNAPPSRIGFWPRRTLLAPSRPAAPQSHHPERHTIVEAHPDVYDHMVRQGWAQRPGVRILKGRWQDVLPELLAEAPYDGIFFDTYGTSRCLAASTGPRTHATCPKLCENAARHTDGRTDSLRRAHKLGGPYTSLGLHIVRLRLRMARGSRGAV